MAIKISGSTIIDDSRVIVNADKIGIGTPSPTRELSILSPSPNPTGIGVSATNAQSTDVNKAISVFNAGITSTFAVSYTGVVTASEYFGTFKGSIDIGVAIENANKINITDSGAGNHYIHFGSATSGYDDVEVDSTDLVYNDQKVGIGTDDPTSRLHILNRSSNLIGVTTLLTLHSTRVDMGAGHEVGGSIRFLNDDGNNAGQAFIEANCPSIYNNDPSDEGERERTVDFNFVQSNAALNNLNTNLTIKGETGNVGIGSTIPIAKLDVNGSLNVSDDIFVGVGATVGFGTTAYFRDNARAVFGDDENLSIYFDGSNSYLEEFGSGQLYIRGSAAIHLENSGGTKKYFRGVNGGSAELFFDGNEKIKTTEEGILVSGGTTTGDFKATGVSTFSDNIFVGTGATVGFGTTAYFNHTAIIDGTLTVGSNHSFITGGAPTDEGNLAVYGTGKNSLIIQTTSNNDDRGIAWRNAGDAYVAYIAAVNRGNSTADLRFGVDNSNNSNVNSVEERMRITREGNVGINSTAPIAKLDVDGSFHVSGNVGIGSTIPAEKFVVSNDAGNVTSFIEAIAGDALLDISNTGNGNFSGINFERERKPVGGEAQTRINGGSIFMPSNTANNEAFLYIQAQSTSAQAGVTDALTDNNGVRLKLHGDDGIFSIETGASERLRVTADGNVGIGTTNSTQPARLVVRDTASTLGILTSSTDGANLDIFDNDTQSRIRTVNGQLQLRADVGNSVADSSIRFFVDGASEKLRITADGDVGIGTINPTGVNALTNNTTTLAVGILTATQIFGPVKGALEPTGDVNVPGDLTVTGDINANGNIVGDSATNISGMNQITATTFVGDGDFVDLDVDGTATLDDTTIDGLLDINAGGQANTFKVEDLTSGRVVLAGTGGELEDSGNLTFNGSLLNVTGDGAFSGNVSIAGTLTYEDVTNVDSIGLITARNGVHVTGAGVSVAGISTFIDDVDINGDLDVDGHTDLDNVNISGVTTMSSRLNLNTIKFGPGNTVNDDAHIEWLGTSNAGYLRISTSDDSDSSGTNEYIEIGDYSNQNRGGSFTQHVRISRDQFLVRTGSNSITPADRFIIDSGGKVGIGTNIPDQKLHVHGDGNVSAGISAIAGDAVLDITNSGNGNYSGINFIRERGSGQTGRNGGSIFMPSNTANNEAFLYIQAQSTSAQAGVTDALTDNNGVRLKLHGDDGIFSIETGASERLRITSTGDVGIGTINPTGTNALTNNNTTLAVGIVTANEYFGTFKGTIDTDAAITNANNINITNDTSDSGTHYIHFGSATSGYDGVEVDSTGLVYKDGLFGVGTNNPNTQLTVVNPNALGNTVGFSTQKILKLQGAVGNAGILEFKNKRIANGSDWTSSTFRIQRVIDVTEFGYIDFGTGGGVSGNDIQFGKSTTSSTDVVYMHLDSTGNVGIGTDDPSGRLHISSGNSGDCRVYIEADPDNNDEGDNPFIIFKNDGGIENASVWCGNTDGGTNDNSLNLSASTSVNGGIRFFTGDTDGDWETADERARITPDGELLINAVTARSYVDGGGYTQTPKLQVESNSNVDTAISLRYNSGAGAVGRRASFIFARTADGTAVSNNSVLGEVLFMGEGNSTLEKAASIRAEVDNTPGTNDMPGRLIFSTSADGSDSPTERLRITSGGDVGIGTINPTGTNALTNNNTTLAVGIVTANEYFGTFKGTIDSEVAITNANNVKIKHNSINDFFNVPFFNSGLSDASYAEVKYDSSGSLQYNPNLGNLRINSGAGNTALIIRTTSNELDRAISFQNSGFAYVGALGFIDRSGNQADLAFFTGNANNNIETISETMRLTKESTVGIGTTRPDGLLHVFDGNAIVTGGSVGIGTTIPLQGLHISGEGAGQNTLRIDTSGTAIAINNHTESMGFIGNDSGALFINAGGTEDTLSLRTNGTERLRIASNGNVGIGTTNPQQLLHVETLDSTARIHIERKTGGGVAGLVLKNTNKEYHVQLQTNAFQIFDKTATTERFRITSDGNVGINTNDPTGANALVNNNTTLAVGIVTANEYFGTFKGTIDPETAANRIEQGNTKAQVVDTGSDGHFLVETEGDERLRIDSTGKVCIAHSNALHSGNLQVSTSSEDAIDINAYSSTADEGGRLSFYRSKNASIGSNTIVVDNDSLGRIDFRGYNTNGNSYDQGARIEAVVDGTVNSSTDMPSALVFKTSANGSAEPSERLRILSDGNVGIGTDSTGGARLRVYKDNALSGDDRSVLLQQWRGSLGSTGERALNLYSPSTDSASDYYRFQTGNAFKFQVDSIDALCINSSGLVGIGTGDIKSQLHVESATGTATTIIISQEKTYGVGSGTAERARLDLAIREVSHAANNRVFGRIETGPESETTSQRSFLAFSTRNSGTISEKLRIVSDGSVGIKNDSPTSQLDGAKDLVIGNTSEADSGITLVSTTSGQGLIHFSDATSGNARYDGFIGYEQTDRFLKFGTAQALRLKIDSAGNLLRGGTGQDIGASDARWDTLYVNNINASGGSVVVDNYETNNLKVTGIATFQGNVSIAGTLTYEDVTNVDSIGLITARNGIHVTGAGVSVAGISTFIDNVEFKSNVAIGNLTSPDRRLHIQTNGESYIRLTDNDITAETDSAVGVIEFETRDTGNEGVSALIGAYHENTSGTAYLKFSTGDESTLSERVRITGFGSFGLGTNDPATTLEIKSDANAQTTGTIPTIRITNDDGSASLNDITGSVEFFTEDNSDPNHISGFMRNISETNAGVNYSLVFGTKDSNIAGDATEKLRIKSNGYVGIGTNSPDFPLHVFNSTANNIALFESGDAFGSIGISDSNGSVALVTTLGKLLIKTDGDAGTVGTNGDTAMVIEGGGDVGIGTDNPGKKLDVFGTFRVKDETGKDNLEVDGAQGIFKVFQSKSDWSNLTYNPMPILSWDFKSGPGDLFYIGSGGNTQVSDQMALVISDQHGFKVGRSGYDGTDFDVSDAAEYLRVTRDGNVGIGTSIPTGVNAVAGNTATLAVGILTAREIFGPVTGALTPTGDVNVPGNLDVDGTTTVDGLTSSEDMTISRDGDATFTVETSANSGDDSLIKIRGARTNSTTADIAMLQFDNKTNSAYTMAQISAKDPVGAHGDGKGKLVFRTATGGTLSDQMTIREDGNVGINSTAPIAKLDVDGSFHVSGNVGIGSTIPAVKLDVRGDISFNGNTLISSYLPTGNIDHIWSDDSSFSGFNGSNSASTLAGGTWNFVHDGERKAIGNSALQAGYVVSSNGGSFMGDVGIGTTNPRGTSAVDANNTATLAVGILTARQIFGPVTGTLTPTGDVDITGNLDVDGHTDLDNVSIAGVTTFTGAADFDSVITANSNINTLAVRRKGTTNTRLSFDAQNEMSLKTDDGFVLKVKDNKVGINNDSPDVTLSISAAPTFDTETEVIRIARVDNPAIRYHSIKAMHGGANVNNYIAFHLHDGSAGSPHTQQKEILRLVGETNKTGNVGIGTINPIGANALTNNNSTLAVGIVTANEVYGTFKGSIDSGVAIENANKVNITDDTSASGTHYVHFGSATSGYDGVEVDSTKLVYRDGKFGIGTNNPSDLLDVHKSSSTAYDATDDDAQRNDGASITIRNDNGSTNTFSQLVFDTAGSNQSIARIVALRTGTASNALTFVTEHNNTKEEKLRITSDGEVLIGTTTGTGNNLTIQDAGTSTTAGGNIVARFQSNGSGRDASIQLSDNVAHSALISMVSSNFAINLSGTERLRITSDGDVGIGTDNPTGVNAVTSGNTATLAVGILTAREIFGPVTGALTPTGNVNISNDLDVDGATTLDGLTVSEAAVFSSSVTVNSGSATDEGNLAVHGTGKNSLIIRTTDNDSDRGIAWRNSGAAYLAYIAAISRGNHTADLVFGVHNSNNANVDNVPERMRITKEGHVGIGTTTPGDILTIHDTAPGIRLSDKNNLGDNNPDPSPYAFAYIDANAANAIIHADKGNDVNNSRVAFAVDNSEKVRITSSGSLFVGVTTTSNHEKFVVDGNAKIDGNLDVTGSLTYEDVTNIESVGIITAKNGIHVTGGNVGINTISPGSPLTLYSDAAHGTGGADAGLLHFDMGSADPSGRRGWKFKQDNTGTATQLVLQADNNGKVFQIKNSSGDEQLYVYTASSDPYVRVAGNLVISDTIEHTGDDNTKIRFPTADTISFETAGDERLRISSGGKVCVAHNGALHSGNLQVSTDAADAIDINAYSSTAANGGRLSFYRSKNATIGSNTIVVDNDSLGRIDFRGYNTNGNSYNQGATIEAVVDGSVNSSTDMPTAILFKTSADGSSSPSERLRINSVGITSVQGQDDQDNFIVDVNGTEFAVHSDASDGEVSLRAQDRAGSTNSKYMTFFTQQSGSAAAEKVRITETGAIAFSGASNYGTSGQILKSNGNAAPTWVDSSTVSGVTDVVVTQQGRSHPCTLPITVDGTSTKTIGIGTLSNAFGAKYVGENDPTVGYGSSVCDGDIWYDTSGISGISTTVTSTNTTLVIGDVGKLKLATGTGDQFTVPASVFSAGDYVSFHNHTAAIIDIVTATNVTIYLSGSNISVSSGGEVKLSPRALATLTCIVGGASPQFVISGGGVYV